MTPDADTVARASPPLKCAACNRPMESPLVCSGCHALYPSDRLNYFELLALEPRYDLDPAEVRRAYLNLARMTHPDRFPAAAPEVAGLSLQLSARINRAHHVLLDPVLRAEYMLELAGGDAAATDKAVPQAVLTRTLLLREEIEEALAGGDADGLRRVRAEVDASYAAALEEIAALATRLPGTEDVRRNLRRVLNTVKYYQRLLGSFE